MSFLQVRSFVFLIRSITGNNSTVVRSIEADLATEETSQIVVSQLASGTLRNLRSRHYPHTVAHASTGLYYASIQNKHKMTMLPAIRARLLWGPGAILLEAFQHAMTLPVRVVALVPT